VPTAYASLGVKIKLVMSVLAEPMVEKHTVAMHFVAAAIARLSPRSRDRALEAAGIPHLLLEQLNARVPASAFSKLWLAVARELNDEFFGLDRRRMKVGSFALICQALISCRDLDRALRRLLRGFSLFLDDVGAEMRIEGTDAVVRVANRITGDRDKLFADETLMVLTHGLMCWLAGRRIPLTRISFAHPRPDYAREYSLMFCDDQEFLAPATSLYFNVQALTAPVVQTADSLQEFLRTAPQSVFLKYHNDASWAAQLRRRLRGSVGDAESWPVFEQIAAEFRTAPATLRRRLEREGTSYQAVKDRLRSDVAINYLCHSKLSIDEIGARIGFQDASAFHRAFRRWTGVQPGEYRRANSAAIAKRRTVQSSQQLTEIDMVKAVRRP
jgi:AraC-like DNA-binding protein